MNYETLEGVLGGIDADASECHGVLCGLLCARGQVTEDIWLQHILHDKGLSGDVLESVRQQLAELHKTTVQQLNHAELAFDVMLPDDESALVERVSALSEWCAGFVYGLGVGGIQELKELPEDSAEIMSDIVEITKMELDDHEESGEDDYFELVEYVRVGVLLINEELQPIDNTSKTLH